MKKTGRLFAGLMAALLLCQPVMSSFGAVLGQPLDGFSVDRIEPEEEANPDFGEQTVENGKAETGESADPEEEADRSGSVVSAGNADLSQESGGLIQKQPEDQYVKAGKEAIFSVEAIGEGLTYQWQYWLRSANIWKNSSLETGRDPELKVPMKADWNGMRFRCIVVDAYGATDQTKEVRLILKPALKITGQPASCSVKEGVKATFTVTAEGDELTYQWQTLSKENDWENSPLETATSSTLEVTMDESLDGQQYRCVITDSDGDTVETEPVTLSLKANLVINEEPEDCMVESGDDATFSVQASGDALTYQWQYWLENAGIWKNSDQESGNTSVLTIKMEDRWDGMLFRCVVNDSDGVPINTKSVKLILKNSFSIIRQPKSQKVKLDRDAVFEVEVVKTCIGYVELGLQYQWQTKAKDSSEWEDVELGKTKKLSVKMEEALDGQSYRCVIWSKSGFTVTSEPAVLTVKPEIIIEEQPKNQAAELGGTAQFTVSATGDGLKYQWQYQYRPKNEDDWKDSVMTTAKNKTLYVEKMQAAWNGMKFRCVVSDSDGASLTTDVVTLSLKTALSIETQPKNLTARIGGEAKFTVKAKGDGLKYCWQVQAAGGSAWEDCEIESGKKATLSLRAEASMNGQSYRCVITDKYEADVTTNPVVLTVLQNPVVNEQPENRTGKANQTVSFLVGASGEAITYQWQYHFENETVWKNSKLTTAKNPQLDVTIQAAWNGMRFRCLIKDKNGNSTYSNEVVLTVLKDLKIHTQPVDISADNGENVEFKVKASGEELSYQWQVLENGSSSWSNCEQESGTTPALKVQMEEAFDGQKYRCVITDVVGDRKTTKEVTLSLKVALTITTHPEDQTVPLNETARFSVVAEGKGLTYQWQYQKNASATWNNSSETTAKCPSLEVTMLSSYDGMRFRCVVTDATKKKKESNPAVLLQQTVIEQHPEDQSEFSGKNVTFSVKATGKNLKYQWQSSKDQETWAIIARATKITYSVKVSASVDGNSYRCVITDGHGDRFESDPATLRMRPDFKITTQPASQRIPEGETATFSVKATGEGLTYQWQVSKDQKTWTNIEGAVEAAYPVIVSEEVNGTNYRCVVTDAQGKTLNSSPAKLTLKLPLVINDDDQPEDQCVALNKEAVFTVKATGNGLTYQWQYQNKNENTWKTSTQSTANSTELQVTLKSSSYDGMKFRCVVSDEGGEKLESNVAVLRQIIEIQTQPKDQSVASGTKATFSVKATGNSLKYQWQYTQDGETWNTIAGATRMSYSVKAYASMNGYRYRCLVTDGNNKTTESLPAKLTVK